MWRHCVLHALTPLYLKYVRPLIALKIRFERTTEGVLDNAESRLRLKLGDATRMPVFADKRFWS